MRISDQEAGRLRVLEAIRRSEPVARTELADQTGLPAWAISEIVAGLLERDMLVEQRAASGGRGRPRIELRLNSAGMHVVGAALLIDGSFQIEIANLRGDPQFQRTCHIADQGSLGQLAECLADVLQEAIDASGVDRASINSVALCLGGIIDDRAGVLHWFPGHEPAPAPVAEIISRRLALTVHLDNWGNLIARAEHWFGANREVDDFAMVYIGNGVFSGQYVNGLLRRGDHGLNSELGHAKVALEGGPPCFCGASGCLWAYASIRAILRRVMAQRGQAVPDQLRACAALLDDIAQDARAGDGAAAEAFAVAGRALGVAVANYINTWDPSRMVVFGRERVWCEMVEPAFRQSLAECLLPAMREQVSVEFKHHGDIPVAHGAVALVLERLYRGTGMPRRRLQPAALPLNPKWQ